jgi:hypothetical protein
MKAINFRNLIAKEFPIVLTKELLKLVIHTVINRFTILIHIILKTIAKLIKSKRKR